MCQRRLGLVDFVGFSPLVSATAVPSGLLSPRTIYGKRRMAPNVVRIEIVSSDEVTIKLVDFSSWEARLYRAVCHNGLPSERRNKSLLRQGAWVRLIISNIYRHRNTLTWRWNRLFLHTQHGKKGFVIPRKSLVKMGITKIFCYNKMFGFINKTFGCCGKIFGCSHKNFICCP